MRILRKIALGLGALVVLFVLALAAIPLLFGDTITKKVQEQVNGAVNAKVAWGSIGLSLLRDFPNLSIVVNKLAIVGVAPFERDTLLTLDQARLVLNTASAIGFVRHGDPIVIRELTFQKPVARLIKTADGKANWDIVKPSADTTTTASKPVNVSLKKLAITDGIVTMNDQQSKLAASVYGLSEKLSGDFGTNRFVLSTLTGIDSTSVNFAGVSYLNKASVNLDAAVDADLNAHTFTLAKNTLHVNKLGLSVTGTVTTGTPDLGLDLKFSAPSTAFGEILSLVPSVYRQDFDKLKTSGTMALSGNVKGAYGPKAFPSFGLKLTVANGSFQYPDLPLPAKDIAVDLAVDNPGGNVDATVLDLEKLHVGLGTRAVDAKLTLKTPVSDPDVDLKVAGSVSLGDVAKTMKLDGVTDLRGVIRADLATHTRVSDVTNKRFDKVTASGVVNASKVGIKALSVPYPIALDTAALKLTPKTAELSSFAATIGSSDVRASGTLDNLIGYMLQGEDLKGHATVASDQFVLDEWKSDSKTEVIPVPPHVDFGLDATAAKVTFGELALTNVKGSLAIKDQRVTLSNMSMDMLRGTIVANGYYDTVNPDKPGFSMSLGITKLDIPAAFSALTTVQKLAPIAKYAQGAVSGAVSLTGTLGTDLVPEFGSLLGKGDIETDKLVIQDAPILKKLSNTLSLDQLASPALGALKASFDVKDGRVNVAPTTMSVAGIGLTASGSSGLDQTVKFDLAMALPRAAMNFASSSAITKLMAKANGAGASLPDSGVVQLLAQIGGTFNDPTVSANFTGIAASVGDVAVNAAKQMAATAKASAQQKADSAADAAAAKAKAEADKVVADAERQADSVRAVAKAAADKIRAEGNAQIDSLVSKATNPLAKLAAQKAADKLKSETNARADQVIQQGNTKADAIVTAAKQKATVPNP